MFIHKKNLLRSHMPRHLTKWLWETKVVIKVQQWGKDARQMGSVKASILAFTLVPLV